MQQLENYESTIPDAVTSHYLNTAGFDTNDPRIVRLISIATQKFIADIANDTLQHSQMRTNQQNDTQKVVFQQILESYHFTYVYFFYL